jgi:hypothetical protein
MTVLERNVEMAVTSAEGLRWFRGYLRGLLDGGLTPDQLERVLRVVYEHLRDSGQEQAADLVLDGLDLVTGWCGPGMALTS